MGVQGVVEWWAGRFAHDFLTNLIRVFYYFIEIFVCDEFEACEVSAEVNVNILKQIELVSGSSL